MQSKQNGKLHSCCTTPHDGATQEIDVQPYGTAPKPCHGMIPLPPWRQMQLMLYSPLAVATTLTVWRLIF